MDSYCRQAIKEVFTEQGIKPTALPKAAIYALLDIDDPRSAAKTMSGVLGGRDFDWPMLERCLDYCRLHDLHPGRYPDALLQGIEPESKEWFLQQLTIAQLKALAKPKNLALPKLKADIVAVLATELSWPDLDDALAQWRMRQQTKITAAKCTLLAESVASRAYSLMNLEEKQDGSNPLWSWKWELHFDPHSDETMLAYDVIGGYPLMMSVDGPPSRLPPYFPGDTSYLLPQLVRHSRTQIPLPDIANGQSRPPRPAAPADTPPPTPNHRPPNTAYIEEQSHYSFSNGERVIAWVFLLFWLTFVLILSNMWPGWSVTGMAMAATMPFVMIMAYRHYQNSLPNDKKRKIYGYLLGGMWLVVMFTLGKVITSLSGYANLLFWTACPLLLDWALLIRKR